MMRWSALVFCLLLHGGAVEKTLCDECVEDVCDDEKCVYTPDPVLSNFTACPVDHAFLTDYMAYDLSSFASQWEEHMRDVPSLTAECANGTAVSCQRGPINWSRKKVILDTDLENEVDDYVAVVWALLSSVGESRQMEIASIIAAPFSFRFRFLPLVEAQLLFQQDQHNREYGNAPLTETQQLFLFGKPKSPGGKLASLIRLKDVGVTPKIMIERDNHATWCPDVGMEESFQGLQRLVALFANARNAGMAPVFADIATDTTILRGEPKYVTGRHPRDIATNSSEGVDEIIRQAHEASVEEPIYIVCLGAPTNVATALLKDPSIIGKIVLLWDATWGLENRERVVTGSLNFGEDLVASRIILESNVRMLYFPGFPSGQTLQLSAPEVEAWLKGQGVVSDAIYQRYNNNPDAEFSGLGFGRYNNVGTTRVMWDIGNLVPFILPSLLSVQAMDPPRLQRAVTVPDGGCDGYETIGTTCFAEYPTDNVQYLCNNINPYKLDECNDGFFIDWPPSYGPSSPKTLVQAMMLGGLSGPGGSAIDLLDKLQAAGL